MHLFAILYEACARVGVSAREVDECEVWQVAAMLGANTVPVGGPGARGAVRGRRHRGGVVLGDARVPASEFNPGQRTAWEAGDLPRDDPLAEHKVLAAREIAERAAAVAGQGDDPAARHAALQARIASRRGRNG